MLVGLYGLLCILFFFFPFVSSGPTCTLVDEDSLMSFRQSLSPISLNSWTLKDSNCCQWEGISCDNQGWVTHIWLPGRGLTGPVSPFIANLTHLSHLNLSHNKFFGTLPSGLLWLDNLEILDLSFNGLSGELPPSPLQTSSSPKRLALRSLDISSNLFTGEFPSFSLLQRLTNVNASNNSFSGPIPSSICVESSFIKLLDFSENDFSGEIPMGLGGCSKLEMFEAGFNNLSGPLPNDLYGIITLQHLSLPFNRISGVISGDRVVNLANLTVLNLSYNELRGELPRDIGKLRNLEELLIETNKMSGSLPLSLGNCTKLKSLNLRANFLGGNISTIDFSSLSQLQMLDLGKNNFTGTLPVSLYSCKSLTWLRLATNRLQGQILPAISSLKSLSFLSLSYNRFKNISGAFRILTECKNLTVLILSKNFIGEEIPNDSDIDPNGFQNLQFLGIGKCKLKGRVPAWLTKLRKLEVLDLSNNELTGSIPSWLGTLPSLFNLDLSSNLLSGELPVEITSLPTLMKSEEAVNWKKKNYLGLSIFIKVRNASSLQYRRLIYMPPAIFLRNNSLNGTIPTEIGRLKLLHMLDLSHNEFTGKIPDQLSNLTNLEKLDLSANHLSGEIPTSLKRLHFMSWFNVADNNLCGSIPSGGQFDTFPNSSYEGNPRLVSMQPCTHQPGEEIYPHDAAKDPHEESVIFGLNFGLGFGGAFLLTVVAFWKMGFFNRGKEIECNRCRVGMPGEHRGSLGKLATHLVVTKGKSALENGAFGSYMGDLTGKEQENIQRQREFIS